MLGAPLELLREALAVGALPQRVEEVDLGRTRRARAIGALVVRDERIGVTGPPRGTSGRRETNGRIPADGRRIDAMTMTGSRRARSSDRHRARRPAAPAPHRMSRRVTSMRARSRGGASRRSAPPSDPEEDRQMRRELVARERRLGSVWPRKSKVSAQPRMKMRRVAFRKEIEERRERRRLPECGCPPR